MKMTVTKAGDEIRARVTRNAHKSRKGKSLGTYNMKNERTSQSISRTKKVIKELCQCNDFDLFVTIEFRRDIAKSQGIDALMHGVILMLTDWRTNDPACDKLEWLLIPEPYSDRRKCLHIHGLLKGVPHSKLISWRDVPGRKPKRIVERLRAGKDAFTSPVIADKYGFVLAEPIENKNKVATYITKEIENARDYRSTGKHLYYASRGLARPQLLGSGDIFCEDDMMLKSLASAAYAHRPGPDGPIYGMTYICNDDTPTLGALMQLFADNDRHIAT